MPGENVELLDDFQLDMDIETITLDDVDLAEYDRTLDAEEPLSSEDIGMSVGDVESLSIGSVDTIELSAAPEFRTAPSSVSSSPASAAELPVSPGLSGGAPEPQAGGISFDSASPVNIQGDVHIEIAGGSPVELSGAEISLENTGPLSIDAGEISMETGSINMDSGDISMGTGGISMDSAEIIDQNPVMHTDEISLVSDDIPMADLEAAGTLTKSDTLSILEGTPEPGLAEQERAPYGGQGADLSGDSRRMNLESSSVFDAADSIISIDGSELDRVIYGVGEKTSPQTLSGVTVVREVSDDRIVIHDEIQGEENLVSPNDISDNFELIVESATDDMAGEEIHFESEPTEEIRSVQGTVIPAGGAETTMEMDEMPVPDMPVPEMAPAPDAAEFQFDLSAIPDVEEVNDDEPIALSLDELNNIEVSEVDMPSASGPVEDAAGVKIDESEDVPVEGVIEEEIELSEQNLAAIADNERFEESTGIDLEEVVEMAEPEMPVVIAEPETAQLDVSPAEVSGVLSEPLSSDGMPELSMEDETVEISLEELDEIQQGIMPEQVTQEAYQIENEELPVPELNTADDLAGKRDAVVSRVDGLSGGTKDELKEVLSYLDNLLESLPEDKIKEFAKSDYYDLYVKLLDKLEI